VDLFFADFPPVSGRTTVNSGQILLMTVGHRDRPAPGNLVGHRVDTLVQPPREGGGSHPAIPGALCLSMV
jgi:hypothetical protein